MRHFDSAMLERPNQRRHQSARVHAAFLNEGRALTCNIQPWFHFAEFRCAERPRSLNVLGLSSDRDLRHPLRSRYEAP